MDDTAVLDPPDVVTATTPEIQARVDDLLDRIDPTRQPCSWCGQFMDVTEEQKPPFICPACLQQRVEQMSRKLKLDGLGDFIKKDLNKFNNFDYIDKIKYNDKFEKIYDFKKNYDISEISNIIKKDYITEYKNLKEYDLKPNIYIPKKDRELDPLLQSKLQSIIGKLDRDTLFRGFDDK